MSGVQPDSPTGADDTVEIIAHRGYSARAPENTVAAIRLAMECGAPAVEWDMHVSADGTPHLFHDKTVDRTTSSTGDFGALKDSEIELLDAGSWFDPSFGGEGVPTLRRALQALAEPVKRIYPEIKSFHSLDDVDRMVADVGDTGWLDRAVFISMRWDALERIRSRHDNATVGYIAETEERYPEAIERARGDPHAIVDPDVRIAIALEEESARAVELGIPLAAWTINDVETAQRAIEVGIRSLTTNEVETLLRWNENRTEA